METLRELYEVILDRKANPQEGSYTNYLLVTALKIELMIQ